MLLTDNKVLVNSAKKMYGKFLVPNDFSPKKTLSRTNSIEDKIDLDIKTSKNLIGEIINLSQILNSEYWDRVSKKQDVKGLYELICQLDVMSCIEIDKAKKESVVDATKELKAIRESKWISYGKISRQKEQKVVMCRPWFFKYVGFGKNYKFVRKNTPMDFLQKIIDEEIPRADKIDNNINFLDLIIEQKTSVTNTSRINNVMDKIDKLNNEIKKIWLLNVPNEEKYNYITMKKQNTVNLISKIKLNEDLLIVLLKRLNNTGKDRYDNLKKSSLLLLNTIYNSHKDIFINLFKTNKEESKCLLKEDNENYSILIYDKRFKKEIIE